VKRRESKVRPVSLLQIDKKGVIRYIDMHDMNKRPRLEDLARALQNLHD
jgi:peroxiredoxin (alkyl hydroperoxide reductase subunit C)